MIKVDHLDERMEYCWMRSASDGVSNATSAPDYNLMEDDIMYSVFYGNHGSWGFIPEIQKAVEYVLKHNWKP